VKLTETDNRRYTLLFYAFGRLWTEQFMACCLRRARWPCSQWPSCLPVPAVMRQFTKIDEAEGYILLTFYKFSHSLVMSDAYLRMRSVSHIKLKRKQTWTYLGI